MGPTLPTRKPRPSSSTLKARTCLGSASCSSIQFHPPPLTNGQLEGKVPHEGSPNSSPGRSERFAPGPSIHAGPGQHGTDSQSDREHDGERRYDGGPDANGLGSGGRPADVPEGERPRVHDGDPDSSVAVG